MSKLEKVCINTINEIKKFLNNRVDYEIIESYIEKQQIEIEECQNMSKNKSSEYIDKLVDTLNDT